MNPRRRLAHIAELVSRRFDFEAHRIVAGLLRLEERAAAGDAEAAEKYAHAMAILERARARKDGRA